MLGFGNLITVEIAMIFGLGFLSAALAAIPFISAIHQRAVRLTKRRLDASVPLSVKEMQAEKDLLRGKFAAATVELEGSIEALKHKTHANAAELGRKSEVINRLKAELDVKAATLAALEARERILSEREKDMWNDVVAARNEVSARIAELQEAERANAQLRGEVQSLIAAVEQRGQLINTQYNEIAALNENDGAAPQPLPRASVPERRTFGMRPAMPAPAPVPAPATAPQAAQVAPKQPVTDNVKPFEPRTTSEWLEYGKAKLRAGSNGGGSAPERVKPEHAAYGVRPL